MCVTDNYWYKKSMYNYVLDGSFVGLFWQLRLIYASPF